MNGVIKVISGLVFFLVMLHVPIIKINTPTSINPVFNYEIKTKNVINTTMNYDLHDYVYHLPVSGNFNSSHQYEINKLDKTGNLRLAFKMPLDKDVLKKENPDYAPDKDGFITYPENGSFYLWYPRLGTHALFYDQDGQFLWSRKSSHYLKAFPSGKYILSMTGDHSRAFFLLPDLSVMGSLEGTLLINYQFSNDPSSSEIQVCLGFLDGNIAFYDPTKKNEFRVSTGALTKSIACNFHKLYIAAQVESSDKSMMVDLLRVGEIKTGKNVSIDWKFSLPLLDRYTSTLPIGLSDEYGIVLLPEKKSLVVLAFDITGKILHQAVIANEDSNIEDWRIYPAKKGLVAWNSAGIYIFNPHKIYEKKIQIENVTIQGDEIFIQNREQILALQLTD
ncbi:MAG: hypothetical protein OEV78_04745 [Spirochaetia bacterium]|nr:hypothetical protein [Spirochaetia bacterium]